MIKILCESNFCDSVWCKRILTGITTALKKKRRKFVEITENERLNPELDDCIFLVGSNDKWINEKVELCNNCGTVPIVVCNQYGRICKGKYHSVTVDIESAMKELYEFLINEGRKKFVFYGLNEASTSDRGRAECFGSLCADGIEVIENNGSIDEAFNELYGKITDFDAVICANNFVAFLLVKKLIEVDKTALERLRIVSCAKNILSSSYNEYIITQSADFEELGRASAELYEFLFDKEYVACVTLNVRCYGLEKNQSEASITIENKSVSDDAFYKDSTIITALKIDNLISACKDEDLQIIRLICMGKTYTRIAEECYMSESNVKYHVKKYTEILGLRGRDELQNMLKEYVL